MAYIRQTVTGRNKLDINTVAQVITQNFDDIGAEYSVSLAEVSGKNKFDIKGMAKTINDNLLAANVATGGVLTYSNVSARLKTDLQDMVATANAVLEQVDAIDESSSSSESSASSDSTSSSSSSSSSGE